MGREKLICVNSLFFLHTSIIMEVEDKHSIYVMANGYTREDVETQVERWVNSPEVQDALASVDADDTYALSLATNYDGVFLGYGYIYCVSSALYHVLLGRQPTGLDGVLVDARPPMARLARSLKALAIAWPVSRRALDHIIAEVVRRNGISYGMVYLQITRGVARIVAGISSYGIHSPRLGPSWTSSFPSAERMRMFWPFM